MKRRQLLAGLGTLAGGGGLLISTGAFTSVEADRTATVAVADEDQAYLAIEPSPNTANGAFANQTSGSDGEQLALDFNNSIPNRGSVGVGQSSEYEFDDVFRITNQGAQTVYLNISDVATHGGSTLVEFYVPDGSGGRHHIAPGANDLEIGTGVTENIGVYIETAAESSYSTPSNSAGTAAITANASSDDPIV
jgi:hypothetical protein